jgi:hypothetical protein
MSASVSASPNRNARPSSSRSSFSKWLAQRARAARIAGPEFLPAMARREVAQEACDSHTIASSSLMTDAAMRIHRQEAGRIEPAEAAAGVDMLMHQSEFADQPHHLLDVERTARPQTFSILRL